jgi:hypothetical protein
METKISILASTSTKVEYSTCNRGCLGDELQNTVVYSKVLDHMAAKCGDQSHDWIKVHSWSSIVRAFAFYEALIDNSRPVCQTLIIKTNNKYFFGSNHSESDMLITWLLYNLTYLLWLCWKSCHRAFHWHIGWGSEKTEENTANLELDPPQPFTSVLIFRGFGDPVVVCMIT